MTAGSNTLASYTYNADGLRIAKTVNGVTTEYVLNGSQVMRQIIDNGTTTYIADYLYHENGTPLGFAYYTVGGTPSYYFYETNLQGDVVAIYDSNGSKVVSFTYDAWGCFNTDKTNTTICTDTFLRASLFRYRSYIYDYESGLYYLQSRYYDPQTGRFISMDSVDYLGEGGDIASFNLYAYCLNNPVIRYDPHGNACDVILDIVSIIWSAYDFIKNPSLENFGWLALDVVFAIVPFLTGSRIMKAASKLNDISDIGWYMNKFDNVYDSIAIGNDMGRVTNLAFDTGSMIYDGYKQLNTLYALGKVDEVTDAMKYAAKVDNARFIIDKYQAGYKIINAGSDGRGFFKIMKSAYGMELKILYRLKYGNKLHKLWWVVNSGRRLIW